MATVACLSILHASLSTQNASQKLSLGSLWWGSLSDLVDDRVEGVYYKGAKEDSEGFFFSLLAYYITTLTCTEHV